MSNVTVVVNISATIPTGSYENYKPSYSIHETFEIEGDSKEAISKKHDELKKILRSKLNNDYEYFKIERIKKQRKDIRFYPVGDKQFPSVTSITGCLVVIEMPVELLKQYGARGTIVHKQIEHFFKTNKWEEDITKIPGTKTSYIILKQGSLNLRIKDCNFMGFWDKYSKDIEPIANEVILYNEEHQYAGTADLVCKYKGEKAILDFKTSSSYEGDKLRNYWKQCAAYAKCIDATKLLIAPLNPKNKSGFGNIMEENDINYYFNLFLQDRDAFREIYDI